MNEHVKIIARERPTTRAAEGLPRWRWTTAELERMVASGVLDPDAPIELIGGEIVPMSPKGRRHELVAELLERVLRKQETDAIHVVGEKQLNLTDDTYCEPDIIVRPAAIMTADLRGETVLLVIEVADSSLGYDMATKASLYAGHGVREYWVADAWKLETTVHRVPDTSRSCYADIERKPASALLTPMLAPVMSARLADLGL